MEIKLEKRKLYWTLGTVGFPFFFFPHSTDCLSERKLHTKQIFKRKGTLFSDWSPDARAGPAYVSRPPSADNCGRGR